MSLHRKLKGKYIAFEGIDGTGKSTQLKMFSEYLNRKAIDHVVVREPGGYVNEVKFYTPPTPKKNQAQIELELPIPSVGEQMRSVIMSNELTPEEEILLFDVGRLHTYRTVIKPAIEKGFLVLSDRSFLSSLVYQAMKVGALSTNITKYERYFEQGLLKIPDVTFLYRLNDKDDYSHIEQRLEERKDNNRLDPTDLTEAIERSSGYELLLKQYTRLGSISPISAQGSMEKVHKETCKVFSKYVKQL